MTNMYFASPAYTMFDSTKGSMTNRYQCAKEHFKNNLNYGLKGAALGAATGGVAYAAYKNPGAVTKLATKVGKLLSKKAKFKLPDGAIGKIIDPKIYDKLMQPKYLKKGKAALVLGGVALVGTALLHLVSKFNYKKGQIDQKYTDAAKIESQTKNVILESKLAAQDVKELKAQNARGLYC